MSDDQRELAVAAKPSGGAKLPIGPYGDAANIQPPPTQAELKEIVKNSVTTLLEDRRKTHGSFNDHAAYTQAIKQVIVDACATRKADKMPALSVTQLESLEMIAHKMGRILAGDPSFADHWDDIAGYAKIANGVDK